jgi:hypothetical protein
MYHQKIIQNLKPGWYYKLSTKEKKQEQADLRERHEKLWKEKPELLPIGTIIIAKETRGTIKNNNKYVVQNHICTLVSTLYGSEWHQFVTIKNNYGWTVKVNLNNFEIGG